MDREYKDTEYKEVEVLTNEVDTPNIHTANVPKRINVCGFEPEMWKKQYPGLKTDYFSNIQEYCQEKNIDENKINKEVLNLAIEVAQQVHSTGVENDKENGITKRTTAFIKYFEDGFEPNTIGQENSGLSTPVAHSTGVENWIKKMESQKELPDMVEEFIVARKTFWELTGLSVNSQKDFLAFLQWLIIRGSKHKRGKGRMVIIVKCR